MIKSKDLFSNVAENIEKHGLLEERDHVLIGFSGGADSTALLLVLWHLRSKLKIKLLAAHINYNLRPDENRKEEKFVKKFCFQHNISLLINHYDPSGKEINENNLREYRLNWFKSLNSLYKIDKIALGHNRGDQAETIYYRLLRGSLLTGLGGIHPLSGNIIHPLLTCSRKEITQYLKSENLSWCEDSSNHETHYVRNKIRNIGFPWIKKNINPKVEERISETSTFLQEADEILRKTALLQLHTKIKVKHNDEEIRLDIKKLLNVKAVLRFYIYRYLYSEITGCNQDFYQSNFYEIDSAIQQSGNRQIQLPNNIVIEKEYDQLVFYLLGRPPDDFELEPPRELSILRNRFSYSGWRVIMKKVKSLPKKRNPYFDKQTIYLDYDKIVFPLTIRHREPGDRFIPYGMKGEKKVKDFFIDLKVPPRDRDRAILFCDADKIFWIGSYRSDQRVAITEETSNILMIKLEKIKRRKARAAERK